MNNSLINKYIWLIDTLRVHGRLSRARIDALWRQSGVGGGNPLPERTFHHYRRSIEEIFHITIRCSRSGEYFIEDGGAGMSDWLLDSFAVNSLLADTPDLADRIEVEEVPSAREFLPAVVKALRESVAIRFDYAGFNRSMTERGIEFEPYFLKRYKQRWYMIGRRSRQGDLRTYALDRVKAVESTGRPYSLPEGLTVERLFDGVVGVTNSEAPVRTVRLRATRTQAKYLRALPLHASQEEEKVADDHSIFRYRLKLNYELVHELMSLGEGVRVEEPRELQIMVASELKKALGQYDVPEPSCNG